MKIDSEFENIEEVVNLYLQGLYNRKFSLLEEAFWEEVRNVGVTSENEFWLKIMEFWREKCKISTSQESEENRYFTIENIDVWHNSAVVRVKMRVKHTRRIYECTDFLSFLKINGKWKIVHKLWSARDIPR